MRQALASGHQVRLLTRPGSRRAAATPRPPGVQAVPLDPADTPRLTEAMRGCDAVIHLIGIISECGAETFERVHEGRTGEVLAAAEAAGVPRWIHMSALGTRADAPSRYHTSKWAAEEQVRSSDLQWTLFRPSLIYGPGDGFTRLFDRMARWSPLLPVMGPGTNLLQPVAVSVVAQAFVGSLERPESVGRTYDLCGPDRLSFRDVLGQILRAGGRRRMLVSIPLPLARLQARLLERLYPALLSRAPPLNTDQLLMLQEDNVGDGTEADRVFGLRHEPFGEGLRRYLGRTASC